MTETRAPQWVHYLVSTRRFMETVIGQLTDLYHIQKVWGETSDI